MNYLNIQEHLDLHPSKNSILKSAILNQYIIIIFIIIINYTCLL